MIGYGAVPDGGVDAAGERREAGERVFRLGEIVAGERGVELVA